MDKFLILLILAAGVVLAGSIAIFAIESGQSDSQITTFLDAVWWTVATVTTVGYGDIVPVTDAGRMVSIFYMFFGITIFAISLSVLGSNFYRKRFQDEKEISHAQQLILDKIKELQDNQEKLQKELGDLIDKSKNNSNKI